MAMVQRPPDASASAEEIAELERNGVAPEQCRRLVALRERVRDGGYDGDGPGEAAREAAFVRRLTFARWLVEHGQISDFDEPGSRL